MPSRLKLERETSIVFNDLEEEARIWTFSPKLQRHLSRRGFKPLEGRSIEGPYVIPKTCVKIQGKRAKRAANPAALEALKRAREARG